MLLLAVCAQGGRAESPDLAFDGDGEFRILQITDLHFNPDKEAAAVFACLDTIVPKARPDLLVLTGDNIYAAPSERSLRILMSKVDSFGIPFCVLWGNHDDQFDLSKARMYDIVRSFPNCVMPARAEGVESPDYELPIKGSGGSVAALLYCIDSNTHIFDENGSFVAYDFIHDDQVEAYRAKSKAYTAANGGVPYPALAFFHIPLPEYDYAVQQGLPLEGICAEGVCAPKYNSGMFAAFRECGDVFATFAGHDHDNDFSVLYDGILLAYGRFSGSNTEYNNLPNGGRVIVLKENSRELETYIIQAGTNGK